MEFYLKPLYVTVYGADYEVDPMCQYCDYNYVQSSHHIIGECPALVEIRQDVFSLHIMEPPFNFPIKSVIKFLKLVELEALRMDVTGGGNQTS